MHAKSERLNITTNHMDWYVIHTKPRQEERALINLNNQGYTCYLPRREKQVLRGRTLTTKSEALFPRYLFINLRGTTNTRSWAPIRSTLGVSRLLTFGTEPARIDDRTIVAMQDRELRQSGSAVPIFQTGDKVHIVSGPFAGFDAVFEISDGDTRVKVLIELLSQSASLTLPVTNLRRGH